jgi:hypothetical protein
MRRPYRATVVEFLDGLGARGNAGPRSDTGLQSHKRLELFAECAVREASLHVWTAPAWRRIVWAKTAALQLFCRLAMSQSRICCSSGLPGPSLTARYGLTFQRAQL